MLMRWLLLVVVLLVGLATGVAWLNVRGEAPIPATPWPHANATRRERPGRGLWRHLRRALGLERSLPED